MKNYSKTYPVNTFHGVTQREILETIKQAQAEMLDYIADSQGWEESRDVYADKFKLPLKYPKLYKEYKDRK